MNPVTIPLRLGWTTYLERLLVQAKEGSAARGLSYIIGRKALDDDLKEFQEAGQLRFMSAVVDYKEGEDPECVWSRWKSVYY